MQTRRYEVILTGRNPMLMHHDNVEWRDLMEEWLAEPKNKEASKPGDDRTPAWRWIGCLYHDGQLLALPQDMIMKCFMQGGAMVTLKGKKTFKAQTQSGMICEKPFWDFFSNGRQISMADINSLTEVTTFGEHIGAAKELGFRLFVKPAILPGSRGRKHIRVRPIFDNWSARGTLIVWDELLTEATLTEIIRFAGEYKGLGDWRPGAPTPGPHGTFDVGLKEIT